MCHEQVKKALTQVTQSYSKNSKTPKLAIENDGEKPHNVCQCLWYTNKYVCQYDRYTQSLSVSTIRRDIEMNICICMSMCQAVCQGYIRYIDSIHYICLSVSKKVGVGGPHSIYMSVCLYIYRDPHMLYRYVVGGFLEFLHLYHTSILYRQFLAK